MARSVDRFRGHETRYGPGQGRWAWRCDILESQRRGFDSRRPIHILYIPTHYYAAGLRLRAVICCPLQARSMRVCCVHWQLPSRCPVDRGTPPDIVTYLPQLTRLFLFVKLLPRLVCKTPLAHIALVHTTTAHINNIIVAAPPARIARYEQRFSRAVGVSPEGPGTPFSSKPHSLWPLLAQE